MTRPCNSIKTGAETYSLAIADAHNYMQWLVSQFDAYLRGTILEIGNRRPQLLMGTSKNSCFSRAVQI